MDVSKTIFSANWCLVERGGWVCLEDSVSAEIILSPKDAREVWQVLNKWVERNAPNVEADE